MNCEYGCGQEAKYQFKNGKFCCSEKCQYCSEVRSKISKTKIGSILSEKTKIKMSIAQTGIKPSDETRKKLSESKKGIKNPNYKKSLSKQTKIKMSISHKGNKSSLWKGGYATKNIPRFNKYYKEISFIDKCRRNIEDQNILEVKCTYCGIWYIPKLTEVNERVRYIKKGFDGCRLYCSDKCKEECPIFNRSKWPKGFKPATSREVQPELRQMRFEIDNYTCQKCNKHQDELKVSLHCHHIEGIRWEPLESADIDKVITYCKTCHKETHLIEGCGYNDMKCNKEKLQ